MVRAQRIGGDLGMGKQFQSEFLSDGRVLAVAWDRNGWAVYRDDEPLATYPAMVTAPNSGVAEPGDPSCASQAAILARSVVVAERAPVAAWWERIPGDHPRWRVVRDGRAVSGIDCAWPVASERIVLSADGAHVAYLCGEASPDAQLRMSVVHDGTRYGPFRNAYGVVLSADGRQIAYGAQPVDAPLAPDVPGWDLRIDAKRFAGAFVGVWLPRFGPDDRHVAWEAQPTAQGRPRVGIDGMRLAAFDEVVAGPVFVTPTRVAWVLARGRRVVWFEAEAPAARGAGGPRPVPPRGPLGLRLAREHGIGEPSSYRSGAMGGGCGCVSSGW